MAQDTLQKQIEDLLAKTLSLIDEALTFEVVISDEEDRKVVTITISGEDLKLLIGYHAKSLQAWQHYFRTFISRYAAQQGQEDAHYTVVVDIGNYRKEQDERIVKRAEEAIEQVKFLQDSMTLPPMNARHRRLVHMAVSEDGEVTSTSEGEGNNRRVIISLKN